MGNASSKKKRAQANGKANAGVAAPRAPSQGPQGGSGGTASTGGSSSQPRPPLPPLAPLPPLEAGMIAVSASTHALHSTTLIVLAAALQHTHNITLRIVTQGMPTRDTGAGASVGVNATGGGGGGGGG
eukprot:CAMPEP_0182548408 /NCGR_PEP_ID=MMETSP1323-20130603/38790_1 /TAXON_ID=236787 /ORGANISM="Florenciella parvula, Strain RCC1693" /LENGTH=127 /DNA_ID=CAMNT_0024759799 /DNA_START=55 /DNA_END=434 /DNA_ORIENTATION=+